MKKSDLNIQKNNEISTENLISKIQCNIINAERLSHMTELNEKLNELYSISYSQILLNNGNPLILMKPSIEDGCFPFLINNFPFLCEALLNNLYVNQNSVNLASLNILIFLITNLECSIGEHIIDITKYINLLNSVLFQIYPNEQNLKLNIPEDVIVSALENLYTQYPYLSPKILVDLLYKSLLPILQDNNKPARCRIILLRSLYFIINKLKNNLPITRDLISGFLYQSQYHLQEVNLASIKCIKSIINFAISQNNVKEILYGYYKIILLNKNEPDYNTISKICDSLFDVLDSLSNVNDISNHFIPIYNVLYEIIIKNNTLLKYILYYI